MQLVSVQLHASAIQLTHATLYPRFRYQSPRYQHDRAGGQQGPVRCGHGVGSAALGHEAAGAEGRHTMQCRAVAAITAEAAVNASAEYHAVAYAEVVCEVAIADADAAAHAEVVCVMGK